MTSPTVLYVYLGDGSANPSNVPARDLTQEDWDAFDQEQKDAVLAAPQLYQAPTPEPPAKKRTT